MLLSAELDLTEETNWSVNSNPIFICYIHNQTNMTCSEILDKTDTLFLLNSTGPKQNLLKKLYKMCNK